MVRKPAVVACLAVLLAALPARESPAGGITANEIVLGTHLDLSGPISAGMAQLRNGMQMRLDEANEAGGINGRKFRLIAEDNASEPAVAIRAVDKLVNGDKVFAILNAFGSATNTATVRRAIEAGVICFAPWGASSLLQTIAGDSPLLFTTIANYDTTTRAALGWMIDEQRVRKVGVILQEGPFGDLVGAGVRRALSTRDMTLAAEATYKSSDTEFSAAAARMQEAKVDLIVGATIVRETIGIMTAVNALGMRDVKVLTAAPGRNAMVTQFGKRSVEGLYGVGTWNSVDLAKGPAAIRAWAEDFARRFMVVPDESAVLSYAYTDWFVRALQTVGRDLDTAKAVRALQASSSSHPIFYDTKTFKNNHLAPESVRVERVTQGAWTAASGLLNRPLGEQRSAR